VQTAAASITIQESTTGTIHPAPWVDTSYDSNSEDMEWEGVDSENVCSESDEEVDWEDGIDWLDECIDEELLECKEEELVHRLHRDALAPASYYISPGWCATGMENVSDIYDLVAC
jgi:hypothetical protein